MRGALDALHHVTAICSDARRTVAFYRELGFDLVKKTVNFDDPGSYHLYFGDELGRPGTLLTFFEWPAASLGRVGAGTVAQVAFETPAVEERREVEDPDGLRLELRPGSEIALRAVAAYGEPSLYGELLPEDAQLRFLPLAEAPGRGAIGAGSVQPAEALGAELRLPDWLEGERSKIERILTPIS